MSNDYEEPKSSNKMVVIIVSVIAVVAVVGLLACGGLGYLALRAFKQGMQLATNMAKDIQTGQITAEEVLADLVAGNAKDAYAKTSEPYQKQHSFEQFQEFLTKNPLLTKHTSRAISNSNLTPTLMTVQYRLSGNNSSGTCSLTLVKEGEEWKVERFTVP